MVSLQLFKERIQSEFGSLPISENDEVTRKIAMPIDGDIPVSDSTIIVTLCNPPQRRPAKGAL